MVFINILHVIIFMKLFDKTLNIKSRTNKTNGQINLSIPKKEFSKADRVKLCSAKNFKIRIEGLW